MTKPTQEEIEKNWPQIKDIFNQIYEIVTKRTDVPLWGRREAAAWIFTMLDEDLKKNAQD